jgi:hypothetical protein
VGIATEPTERPDHEGSRDLWIGVLRSAVEDALYGAPARIADSRGGRIAETRRARDWIIGLERDFQLVCLLAGVDPEAVRDRLTIKLREAPPPEELIPAARPRKRKKKGVEQCPS